MHATTNQARAKAEAFMAAVEILRNHGYQTDPEEFPASEDRQRCEREFCKITARLEVQYKRWRDKTGASTGKGG